jgi:hypothetical protein
MLASLRKEGGMQEKEAVLLVWRSNEVIAEALIDSEDFERADRIKWLCQLARYNSVDGTPGEERISVYKRVAKNGYDRRIHRLSHFILGLPPLSGRIVDHINGNTLDNRKSNLRIVDTTQNSQNKTVSAFKKSSEYKGVFWDKGYGKYRVAIRVDTELRTVGAFSDEIRAAKCYDTYARKYFGEYARLNFPESTEEVWEPDPGPYSNPDMLWINKTKTGKFAVQISEVVYKEGKPHRAGTFNTLEEAIVERDKHLGIAKANGYISRSEKRKMKLAGTP